jgi:NAD+ kinase
MKAYVYIGMTGESVLSDGRVRGLLAELRQGGAQLYVMQPGDASVEGADILISVGGDGTFLAASAIAASSGVPVVGVNLGRLGFLSENRPENVAKAILSGDYAIEEEIVLSAVMQQEGFFEKAGMWPFAFNEFTVHRTGSAILGVDVCVNGTPLPTYWADGLILATAAGSTAYSLSVGGPIVMPGAKTLIITPIASHNLNIRPLIVPDTSVITFKVHSRDGKAMFTADNRSVEIADGASVTMSMAQFSLKRVRLNSSNFINALTEKLFWGEDIRNNR